jgi:hypothetical protein
MSIMFEPNCFGFLLAGVNFRLHICLPSVYPEAIQIYVISFESKAHCDFKAKLK